jgi:peptide/nickel transport system ATP-binding protein
MAILSLVRELVQSQETTALYITHNLSVLRTLADRIGVMYAGELLEQGDAEAVFDHPIHPYTQGLIRSDPAFVRQDRDLRLYSIPGSRPSEKDLLTGCTFRDRCPLRVDECEQHPELVDADREQKVRCIRWQEIQDGTIQLGVSTEAHRVRPFGEREMLEILDVDVHYPGPRTLRQILANQPEGSIPALDNVNASIREGNTLGLVGESGSGKTSLANAILGLVERSSGEIRLEGETLPKGLEGRDQGLRRKLGVVFQHPIDSFNPRVTLGHSLRRSAQKLLGYSKAESERLVRELVEAVQIPLDYLDRYPDQVSGGEAQRLAIARAFSTRPDVLIADEAVSALDVSIQATILNLLEDLQDDYGSAMLFISHDLAVVEYMADAIAVLLTGVVMEIVPTEKIHVPPIHPYTEALRAALPGADQASISVPDFEDGSSTVYGGQTSGCPYHSRCHRYLGDLCAQQFPPWQDLGEGMGYRCHIAPADLISERRIQMDPEEV